MGRGNRTHRLFEDRVWFETLLADLSAGLIHVDAAGLDAALENGLRRMVGFLGMDRGNLDEYIEGRPGVRVSWAEPGIATLPSILAAGQFPWTADMLRSGRVVCFRGPAPCPRRQRSTARAMRASGHAPTCRFRYRLAARCSACCPSIPFASSAIGRTV